MRHAPVTRSRLKARHPVHPNECRQAVAIEQNTTLLIRAVRMCLKQVFHMPNEAVGSARRHFEVAAGRSTFIGCFGEH